MRGDTFTLSYGGMSSFFGGLDSLVGQPASSLDDAVLAEHTRAQDSHAEFSTSNYSTVSTSEVEYWFVNDPSRQRLVILGLTEWPSNSTREPLPLEHFEPELRKINLKLSAIDESAILVIELMGGRLYTGPMVCSPALSVPAQPSLTTSPPPPTLTSSSSTMACCAASATACRRSRGRWCASAPTTGT